MNGIVLAPIKSENTTLASARIARFLAEKFKIPLLDLNVETCAKQKFEYVFLVNANFGFSRGGAFLPCAIKYLNACKYPIYVNNDYVLTPPGQIMKEFKPRKWFFWSTVPDTHGINIKKTLYVNWNQLTYDAKAHLSNEKMFHKCIYWGAFRKKRSEYFTRFLDSKIVTISTTTRAKKAFAEACPSAKIIEPFKNLYHSVSKYDCTLYLEDNTHKHSKYCSPANRFYEALTAKTAIFFQPESLQNMKEAGINIRPFLVKSPKELQHRIKESKAILNEQKHWRQDFRQILNNQINDALRGTK